MRTRNRVSKTGGLICVPPPLRQVFLASSRTLFLLPFRFIIWVHVGPAMHPFMFCVLGFSVGRCHAVRRLACSRYMSVLRLFQSSLRLFRFPSFIPTQSPIRCIPLCTGREVMAISALHASHIGYSHIRLDTIPATVVRWS